MDIPFIERYIGDSFRIEPHSVDDKLIGPRTGLVDADFVHRKAGIQERSDPVRLTRLPCP